MPEKQVIYFVRPKPTKHPELKIKRERVLPQMKAPNQPDELDSVSDYSRV